MTIHAVNYRMQVDNVVVDYRDRPEGSVSKLNTYSDGIKVLWKIVQLFKTYKPLVFFGIISLILASASVIMFIPILAEYFRTGLVPRFPTLIVSGFLMLAALQSLFAGLILAESMWKDRRDFEYRLNRVAEQKKQQAR